MKIEHIAFICKRSGNSPQFLCGSIWVQNQMKATIIQNKFLLLFFVI